MLTSIKIQNIALIPEVEIELDGAFNVLTGETGAGKSIIIGSFNFILGEKLNKSVIRAGSQFARVDAVFGVGDDLVILTRTLKPDGKSECRINGNIVTVGMLREEAEKHIHIHGQHETETLLKPKNHIDILDDFGRVDKSEYFTEYKKLQDLKNSLKVFGGTDDERNRQIDIYEFQIKEIERANLRDGEEEELAEYKSRMMNFEKISGALNNAKFGDVPVGLISQAAKFDSGLESILERARSVQYEIDDLQSSVDNYLDGLEYDEQKFKNVDSRLDEIKTLKRKYGSTVVEILKFLENAQSQYAKLTQSAEEIEKIKKEINEQEKVVETKGRELSGIRKITGDSFGKEMVGQLKDLGMPACKIEVEFREIAFGSNGCDEIQFLFSANAGEGVKPLANIISGGEMSRFMLALKTLISGSVGTLVFDEIDTGIGGVMGAKIGEKIKVLSLSTQVICVTHLPQIAAMADSHFLILKEQNEKTVTKVFKIEGDEIVNELSRMQGPLVINKK